MLFCINTAGWITEVLNPLNLAGWKTGLPNLVLLPRKPVYQPAKKVCLCFVINKNVCLLNNFTFEDKNTTFENLHKNCWGHSD